MKLSDRIASIGADGRLQQYLPFTVLKPIAMMITITVAANCFVATVPTVYGIETKEGKSNTPLAFTLTLQQYLPFTVLKQEYASA